MTLFKLFALSEPQCLSYKIVSCTRLYLRLLPVQTCVESNSWSVSWCHPSKLRSEVMPHSSWCFPQPSLSLNKDVIFGGRTCGRCIYSSPLGCSQRAESFFPTLLHNELKLWFDLGLGACRWGNQGLFPTCTEDSEVPTRRSFALPQTCLIFTPCLLLLLKNFFMSFVS